MTKIDIISGFLGAGKTTLIKKLLQDAFKGQQIVLIENEFGEIGIDGGFLKDAGIEIREMNSGCICCSLVGDFGTALKEVVEKYHPDRIVIEPSGVGKLSDVIHAVERLHDQDVVLNSAVTVVDVLKCKMYLKNFGEFFKNQVEAAGTIILSRTDLSKATDEKIETAIAMIRELNPDATIITTPVEQLEGKKILDTIEGKKIDLSHVEEEHDHDHHDHEHDENCTCGCHDHEEHEHHHEHDEHHHDHEHDENCTCGCHDHEEHEHHHEHDEHHHDHEHDENCTCGCHDHDHEHHHHHHHADEVFTSWGKETVRKFSRAEIEEILKTLSEDASYGVILRAKGMLEDENGVWTYFDMVPEEYELRDGNPEYTGRICVIGSKMDEEKLEKLWFERG
ncbi:cobalamin biosynthesis protein CobW [Blautia sp. OF03-15BH]|uniref:CobW family GTP-binding protein n=1 Tax=Blautia sp. OF03-15BH TaxID=2292287 RepID=UPI000E53514B|nr:CobW family GTP-binding protein [Blautia sp. OF03-15BH]RGY02862.1 cobalamin biosynthesis protein CobW [Blautia sp. OF03-15BH]